MERVPVRKRTEIKNTDSSVIEPKQPEPITISAAISEAPKQQLVELTPEPVPPPKVEPQVLASIPIRVVSSKPSGLTLWDRVKGLFGQKKLIAQEATER